MIIGEKIKILRKNNNLTQEELAEKLGISRQSVQKWEPSTTSPDISKLLELSSILGVDLKDLLNDEVDIKDDEKQYLDLSFTNEECENVELHSIIHFFTQFICRLVETEELPIELINSDNNWLCKVIINNMEENSNSLLVNKKLLCDIGLTYELIYDLIKNYFIYSMYIMNKDKSIEIAQGCKSITELYEKIAIYAHSFAEFYTEKITSEKITNSYSNELQYNYNLKVLEQSYKESDTLINALNDFSSLFNDVKEDFSHYNKYNFEIEQEYLETFRFSNSISHYPTNQNNINYRNENYQNNTYVPNGNTSIGGNSKFESNNKSKTKRKLFPSFEHISSGYFWLGFICGCISIILSGIAGLIVYTKSKDEENGYAFIEGAWKGVLLYFIIKIIIILKS